MQWGICQALLQERGLQCGRGELRVLRQGSEGTTRARNTWVQCIRLQWITNYLSFVLSPAKKKPYSTVCKHAFIFSWEFSINSGTQYSSVQKTTMYPLVSFYTCNSVWKAGFRLLAVVGGSFQSERWALFNAEKVVICWSTPFVLIAVHLSGIRGGDYQGCILFPHTNLIFL